MIPLMDDFTHIGFACTRFHLNPEDRFAVTGLNCLLGEDLFRSRIASLIAIALTVWILDLAFFKNRNAKRILLTLLHPLTLVPFFWASQISTSLTALFAALWCFFFIRWMEQRQRIPSFWTWLWVPMAGACVLVRFESLAYCGIFALAWILQNPKFAFQNFKKILFAGGSTVLTFQIAKRIFTFAASTPAVSPLANAISQSFTQQPNYPLKVWPFLQLDSLLRYLKNLALPWQTSFYGNWYRWWEISQHPNQTLFWFAGTGVLLSLIYFGLSRYLKAKKTPDDSLQALFMGLILFAGSAGMLSLIPRSDWYYLPRSYLGTLTFFLFVGPILVKHFKTFILSATILGLSSFGNLFLHFKDQRSFSAYETEIAGADHPYLDLEQADFELQAGNPEAAIKTLHRIYEKIPIESAAQSLRAGVFWSQGLYEAWRVYEGSGNETKALEVYRVLRNSTYFPATHACLQIPSIPIEDCLKDDRKTHFCDSLGFGYSRMKTVRPYRIDLEKLCGFRPVQKN
jgi:hypothetical protein